MICTNTVCSEMICTKITCSKTMCTKMICARKSDSMHHKMNRRLPAPSEQSEGYSQVVCHCSHPEEPRERFLKTCSLDHLPPSHVTHPGRSSKKSGREIQCGLLCAFLLSQVKERIARMCITLFVCFFWCTTLSLLTCGAKKRKTLFVYFFLYTTLTVLYLGQRTCTTF